MNFISKNWFWVSFAIPHGIWDLSSQTRGSHPCLLQWKHGFLTTGLPGKSKTSFKRQFLGQPKGKRRDENNSTRGNWSHHHLQLQQTSNRAKLSSAAQPCPTLGPQEPQRARPPCPSPTPRVHPSPCPLSQWCHPAVSSSVVPFSCPQSSPASRSFQMSQLSASGGQSIAVPASASFLPMNTQAWSPLGWTGWISSQSKGLSRVFSNTTVQKHQFFGTQLSSQYNSHIHTWPLEKP